MDNREPIFRSALRYFFVSIFTILGITIGISLLVLGIAAVAKVEEGTPEATYSQTILADAEGSREKRASDSPVILQLNMEGIIGLDTLTSETIRNQLIESREGDLEDNRVKAILMYINTPGGTIVDADGIYRAIMDYKKQYQVPVYAYVDGLCASGGVYISMAADKIYASEVSLVGSVGVIISSFMNFSELLDKLGIKSLTISAGKNKDALNPLRPWKKDEADNLQYVTNYYYQQFVDLVLKHRTEMTRDALVNEYGADVFPAVDAKKKGYIDEIEQSRSNVLKELVKAAEIEGEYQVVTLESSSWLSELMKSEWLSGTIKHKLSISSDLDPQLLNKYLYLYYPGNE